MCYWYQQTQENFEKSDMAMTEAANAALAARTIDFVAPGEQQSEAGHEYDYSSDTSTGVYRTGRYRSVMLRFILSDHGRTCTLTIDGVPVADITIPRTAKGSDGNGFINMEFPIPAALITDASGQVKKRFVVRLTASPTTMCPGLYFMRLTKSQENQTND